MNTLLLSVPFDCPVRDFVALVQMFREAGYRISDTAFKIDSADVTFQKVGATENGS